MTYYFETFPEMFPVFVTIIGLVIGSFLNVVILRLPIMMERDWRSQCQSLLGLPADNPDVRNDHVTLILPRSRCPFCLYTIHAIDNIPVISFLLLKGRCRHCKKPISIRYPLIELFSAILSGTVAWHFGYGWTALFALLFTWSMICLAMIDFDHQLLPDSITFPLLWLGILCNLFGLYTDLYSSVIGAMLGYGILWIIFISFKLITGKDGMGYGDFKLLAALGAWMGWQALPLIILLSSMAGAIVGIFLIATGKRDRGNPIPFGPYLAVAGWISLLWGSTLNSFYLDIL